MRWFTSTALTSSLVLALCGHVWAGAAEDAANASAAAHSATLSTTNDGATAGTQNYYEHVKPNYGTGAALNESGLKPITQAAPLKNVKGTTNLGQVSFMQSTDKPLLRVTMIPNLATGDIAALAIEQDLNATGVIDYTASFGGGGVMISGVCSNGAILCSPGTYSNCIYEKWEADANGGITTSSRQGTPTAQNDLFNCYCFNNHCSRFNNSGALNLGRIEQELAGSLLATFMDKRPDLIVSSVSANDSTVSYFGTKSQSMSKVDGYTAPRKANRDYSNIPVLTANTPDLSFGYYGDSGGLDAAAATENAAMATIPNSLYSIVNNLQKNSGSTVSTCTNIRNNLLYSKTVSSSAPISGTASSDHWVYSRLNSTDQRTFTVEFAGAGQGSPNVYSGLVTIGSVAPPTSASALEFATSSVSYTCPYNYGGQSGTATGFWAPGLTMPSGWSPGSLIMGWPGVQTFGVGPCSFYAEYTEEGMNESFINACNAYETDAKCKIQEEMWDGRPYIANYLKTGFQMAQICNDYPGVIRSYRICKPWMKQKRTYVCDRSTDTNFDAYLTALQPKIKANRDAVVEPTGLPTSPTCEISCKTKMVRKDTEIRNLGVESDVKVEGSVTQNAYDYYVKQCSVLNGSNVCPVDASAGETIVKDCGCLNEFGEALAQSDAINKAANDATCSKVQQ
jgi:hypothetical protein